MIITSVNRDQKLLEEAYESIQKNEPLYFGPALKKKGWMWWLDSKRPFVTIHSDGSVSIDDNVNLSKQALDVIPFKFRRVKGYFDCEVNRLTSLENCPEIVEGSFSCKHNNLKTLEGGPTIVKGSYNCEGNRLDSLEGCPEVINGAFICFSCRLPSLKGGPKIVKGTFHGMQNHFTSLDGAPEVVEGKFYTENFSDEDYRTYVKKVLMVNKELEGSDLDLEVLKDF